MNAPINTPNTLAAPKPGRPSAVDRSIQSMASATGRTKLREAGGTGWLRIIVREAGQQPTADSQCANAEAGDKIARLGQHARPVR